MLNKSLLPAMCLPFALPDVFLPERLLTYIPTHSLCILRNLISPISSHTCYIPAPFPFLSFHAHLLIHHALSFLPSLPPSLSLLCASICLRFCLKLEYSLSCLLCDYLMKGPTSQIWMGFCIPGAMRLSA